MRKLGRIILGIIAGVLFLCLIASGISLLVNRNLPNHSRFPDRLSEVDKACVIEASHLRRALGDEIWPGWGQAQIPIILYNEAYAFLVGVDAPSRGWTVLTDTTVRGGSWSPVADDSLAGRMYHAQQVTDASTTIGGFTVRVGDRWAASFATYDWSRISLRRGIGQGLPPLVRDLVPYSLFWRLVMGQGDRYITTLLHESFHAYQGIITPDKIIAAERSNALEGFYPWQDLTSESAWQEELNVLYQALQTTSREVSMVLVQRFLNLRQSRRSALSLSPELVQYERHQEWMEGLAKYAELSIGLAAATQPGYQASGEVLTAISGFDYDEYERFYRSQLGEVRRISGREGNVRFYYSGMAQAVLLDRLDPAWKPLATQEGVYLEDILADTLENGALHDIMRGSSAAR